MVTEKSREKKRRKKELKRKLSRLKRFEKDQEKSRRLIAGIVGNPKKKEQPQRRVNILG